MSFEWNIYFGIFYFLITGEIIEMIPKISSPKFLLVELESREDMKGQYYERQGKNILTMS